jgi:hypothetical protein
MSKKNKIFEKYIRTEGSLGIITKGSADSVIDKKPKEGAPCKVRGSFEVHKIHNGKCTPVRDIKEKFEETPFGQIVVDEINKAVNDLPEIRLAAHTLSEQETQDLGRQVARTVLQQVRAKMVETLPEMVEEILNQVMSEMDR